MAASGTDNASRESSLSRLASLLREWVVEGGVLVVTHRDTGDMQPVLSTLIQPDGDVVVSVVKAHVGDVELWARHQQEVARRLEPLEAVERWMEAARRYASWGALLGSIGSLGLLLSREEVLKQLELTLLPTLLGLVGRYSVTPLALRILRGWVAWRLKRLPALIEGPPRTP